jgi:hypothetical protein
MQFQILEIAVAQYAGTAMKLVPAYAVGIDGKVLIDARTQRPDWSYDRQEVEKRLEEIIRPESGRE